MARAPKQPQPAPEAPPGVAEVEAESLPQTPKGPSVEFFGEGAEQVNFTVNPAAASIKVFAEGFVVETL